MSVNYSDPLQVQKFRQDALARGFDRTEVDSLIQQRQSVAAGANAVLGGLDISQIPQDQRVGVTNYLASQGKSITKEGDDNPLKDLSEFDRKITSAQLAAKNALKLLKEGDELSGPITTRVGRVKDFVGMPDKGTEYRSAISLAAAQLFNALAGTAQTEPELRRLEKLIPKDTEQETTAIAKLETLLQILNEQAEAYGIALPQDELPSSPPPLGLSGQVSGTRQMQATPIELNTSGLPAKPGDIVRNPETGKMRLFGTVDDDPIFKQDTEFGFRVDNALVRFLADSSLLPIAGSIIGFGAGGVVGGAGGSMAGKSAQQALKELLDPDAQDFSQHARVILTEGLVDAAFSGLALGVGKVGGKALLMLKKPGAEAAEQVAKTATQLPPKPGLIQSKAASLALKGLPSQQELLRQAYPLSAAEKAAYLQKYGVSYYDDLVRYTGDNIDKLTDTSVAFNFAKSAKKEAGKEIGEAISGRAVRGDQIIPDLEKLLKQTKTQIRDPKTGQFSSITKSEMKVGAKRLEEKIAILKSTADKNRGYIPLEDVQKMKQTLQDSFSGTMTEGSSKKLLTGAYGELMTKIEKYGGAGIKESNRKWRVFDLLEGSAAKADEKVIRAAYDAMDLIAGGGTAVASGGNVPTTIAAVSVIKFLRNFSKEPLEQLKIVNKLLRYAVEKNNKPAARSIIRAAMMEGVDFGIDPTLRASLRTGGEVVRNQLPETPQPLGAQPEEIQEETGLPPNPEPFLYR